MDMHAATANAIDEALILRIEEIEGRVPSNAEIANHLLSGLYGNGVGEYRWKGQVILRTRVIALWNRMEFRIEICRPGPPPENAWAN